MWSHNKQAILMIINNSIAKAGQGIQGPGTTPEGDASEGRLEDSKRHFQF